ncbi:helix-turn-helix domain-containing protein [Psychrobacillus sp. NPDC058041]|uniref:helix-turn-helix domain-containing protein n=1 Tax=Psychrobacillus sp. NPDC058041 TaxID=3346310 RepID=UPI0036DDCD2E
MSSIGHIIKSERLNQSMKQITLAKGICSPSYLSKIENNTTVPSEEVITLLLNRLNIVIDQVSSEEENKVVASLFKLYKIGVLKRDKNLIRESLHKITNRKIHFLQQNNYYSYHLYMFRLLLILNEEETNLLPSYSIIVKLEDKFVNKQRFVANLNLGLYYYLKDENYKALCKLEVSLKLVNHLIFDEWELADFYNVLSHSYFKCNEFYNAIDYASKSLKFYKDNLLFERAIDNYIVIGAAHKNLRKYDEAEKNYHLAKKLAIDFKLFSYEGVIYQNLGSLYAIQGRHEKAIDFYKNSLIKKVEHCNSEGCLLTILSIIKEYSKQCNHEHVLSWCKEGLEKMEEVRSQCKYERTSYFFHFEIYRALHSFDEKLENVLKSAINHFEIIQDDRHVQKYSILLANHCFKEHKLKASCLYYQKSIQILLKQKYINQWEDL